ncbi:GT2 family glycosyltransferase [Nocardia tenerifensis]|uniref:GT2 family glycosyltransferase n=1 Tax=Nocardia tenerifensis TaxID=228006 RepID=A0A318K9S6_9NOCA|nr:glycosyltransferase family 2 protein [Nocardia tenerifensis]PXX52294.1 GT2 family glycosyltransferase [Nocardia tenerifensis]
MPSTVDDLGIVIVSHNNGHELAQCLDAVQKHASGAYVVVRDCASTDDTVEIAKTHPAVTRVIAGDNVGFGAGCNDGAQAIDRPVEMLLILNPDTALTSNLSDLLEYVDRLGQFGAVGIRQNSFTGDLVWSWDEFPSPRLEWKKARKQPLLQRSPAGYTQDRMVDWVMGAFILIPKDAFDSVGGFDERWFMFNEEVDLMRRLAEIGRPTWFVSHLSYQHSRADKTSIWRETLRINARRAFDRKWLSRTDTVLCQLAHSYRWLCDALFPSRPTDRRLALPRLLATWNLIHAVVPPESISAGLDSWQSTRPFWKRT